MRRDSRLDKNALRIVSAAIGAELGHLDTLARRSCIA